MSTETTNDRAHVDRRGGADRARLPGLHRRLRQLQAARAQLLQAEIAETVFEPRVGGYLFDRGVDGSECRWARVLAYEPPHRVLLSWDISPHWQLETDPERTSEWEVRFVAEPPQRTRVELEHRDLDHHGEGWQGVREGVAGDDGWPLYLRRYADRLAA